MIRSPSTRTVHAPHAPWLHPFFDPVRPRYSRRASSNETRGSMCRSYVARLIRSVIEAVADSGGAACPTAPPRGSSVILPRSSVGLGRRPRFFVAGLEKEDL